MRSRHRLALGKDRHRGVVPVQALSSEDMGLDQRVKGLQNRDAGTDLVGEGRDAEIDALPGIAFALAVQGLMLPELLEHDGREQVRPGKSARRHMGGVIIAGTKPTTPPRTAFPIALRQQTATGWRCRGAAPSRRLSRRGKAFLDDPTLLFVRPATPAARVNDFEATDVTIVGKDIHTNSQLRAAEARKAITPCAYARFRVRDEVAQPTTGGIGACEIWVERDRLLGMVEHELPQRARRLRWAGGEIGIPITCRPGFFQLVLCRQSCRSRTSDLRCHGVDSHCGWYRMPHQLLPARSGRRRSLAART